MRTLLAILIAAVALSGCLNDDEPDTTDDSMDEMPEQMETQANITTEFSWAQGLGCAGEGLPDPCIAYQNGPGGEGPDGYWIPLTPEYEGMTLTGTVSNQRLDSDCWFIDAAGAIIGDATNGALACAGTVPAGATWVFVYSYAEPHFGLTISFE